MLLEAGDIHFTFKSGDRDMDPNELPIEEFKQPAGQAPPVYQRNSAGEFVVQPSLIERLLSPQSLQWMMLVGGAMLVIGFVVWLWSIGLFENPVMVALAMGGAIGTLIAGGVALVKFTRYQLAGNGMALLGAMAMPLQLWFYHAQDLINLNDGGHLWIPAAGFCLVYAGIARVLRSSAFVYTLVGGVVLTGMLLMADQTVNQFWNLLPQVTFLVGLGWVCVFAKKFFVQTESDFSREKFGQAFYRAGVVAVVSGLSLLLASQIVGVFYDSIFFVGYQFVQYAPSIGQQFWAIGILIITAAGIHLGVSKGDGSKSRQDKLNSLLFVAAWIAISVISLLQISVTLSTAAIGIAIAVIISNVLRLFLSKTVGAQPFGDTTGLCVTSSLVLCAAALVQFCFQFTPFAGEFGISAMGYVSLAQISLSALAALSCSILPRDLGKMGDVTRAMLAMAGSATAIAAVWTGAWVFDFAQPLPLAIAGLSLPLVLSVVSVLLWSRKSRQPNGVQQSLKEIASSMTIAHMFPWLVFVELSGPATTANLWLHLSVLLVAAAIHYLCSFVRVDDKAVRIGFNRMLTYGYLTATVAILLIKLGMNFSLAFITAPALVGLLLMVVGRTLVAATVNDEASSARWALVADYGRMFALFANSAAILLGLNMLFSGNTTGVLAIGIVTQWTVAALAIALSKSEGWKNGFIAATIGLTVTLLGVVNEAIPFSLPAKVEYASVLVGILLLAIGHLSWAKEDHAANSTTTAALWFGSLLTAVPLVIALFCYRYLDFPGDHGLEQYGHEIAALVSLSGLMAAGIMCRIRSTTIVGGVGMMIYIASLLTMIPLPEKLQSISVVMMIGGGIFFTTAILLSVYRDRIIAIPQRLRDGEGVFQVLKWR